MKHTNRKWFVKKSPSPEHSKSDTGSLMPIARRGLEKTFHYSVMVSGEKRDLRIARCFSRAGDANLIASAPEMLDGMRTILQKLEKFRTLDTGSLIRGHILDNIQRIAEENIAKAEGSE